MRCDWHCHLEFICGESRWPTLIVLVSFSVCFLCLALRSKFSFSVGDIPLAHIILCRGKLNLEALADGVIVSWARLSFKRGVKL